MKRHPEIPPGLHKFRNKGLNQFYSWAISDEPWQMRIKVRNLMIRPINNLSKLLKSDK